MRTIFHVDMDAFFASVEQRDDPGLKGKPVVVGGNPKSRGVVCAASYEARKFGVHSAMPCSQAYRLCPQAIFISPKFQKYKNASLKIMKIFKQKTNIVEPLSLDEAFLDLTDNLKGLDPYSFAIQLKEEIFEEVSLVASIGIGPNKFLAKLASDEHKPNGLFYLRREEIRNFLDPLPVRRIIGVGPRTEEKMKKLKIDTIKDLREKGLAFLENEFQSFGKRLYQLARGEDERPVQSSRKRKSLSVERTFSTDLKSQDQMHLKLGEIIDEVIERLDKKNLSGRSMTLKLKYSDFTLKTKSERVPEIERGLLLAAASSQLSELLKEKPGAVRLLGVSISQMPQDKKQLNLDLK